jgi:membrane protease YdiL (CAAX protease family)
VRSREPGSSGRQVGANRTGQIKQSRAAYVGGGPWPGVTLAALAYALAHAPAGSPLLVAIALLCGLAWGTLRATTSSLVPSLLAHLVWDVLVFLWLPLDAR